jgi:hypothetical protein
MANSKVAPAKGSERNKDGPEFLALGPLPMLTVESAPVDIRPIHITQENHESVVFIWFDPEEQSGLNLVGPLRVINDKVQAFNDSSSCFNAIQSSKDKIFFITSVNNSELITIVHNFAAVEAIFILDPNMESVKGDFPKITGIFEQQEELFRLLKEVLEIFEQIQLEVFVFEEEKIFLWSQLWKEEVSNKKLFICSVNIIIYLVETTKKIIKKACSCRSNSTILSR